MQQDKLTPYQRATRVWTWGALGFWITVAALMLWLVYPIVTYVPLTGWEHWLGWSLTLPAASVLVGTIFMLVSRAFSVDWARPIRGFWAGITLTSLLALFLMCLAILPALLDELQRLDLRKVKADAELRAICDAFKRTGHVEGQTDLLRRCTQLKGEKFKVEYCAALRRRAAVDAFEEMYKDTFCPRRLNGR